VLYFLYVHIYSTLILAVHYFINLDLSECNYENCSISKLNQGYFLWLVFLVHIQFISCIILLYSFLIKLKNSENLILAYHYD